MADITHLFGGCSCERNQFVISIPRAARHEAQVFFDNSSASRRAHAAPVVAFLRVPLDFYQSATYAHFDNESHNSIKRTYNTPATRPGLPPTRRQFCGFCGTNLTAWNEALHSSREHGANNSSDYLDVTLGSLFNESLDKLEALSITPGSDSDEEEGSLEGTDTGLRRTRLDDRQAGAASHSEGVPIPVRTSRTNQRLHRLNDRGVPYFEEMIENSRLGRIRRQVGGQTSRDGTSSVQWEVIETVIGTNDDDDPIPIGGSSPKRQRLGS
ncbi:hypothetical protein CKM354_000555700 [Cercospora kikuchii]|uniref:CENP-V/GFA domain-containing protein n=1 Tax=Cercospora kikuchii TaxID=84275 RepID=A0A9P3CFJ1_9PEZI|nr:uncharacterized protein CKM354_000555700 [Cercospora kikuchii]GIZ42282.1 hypothetical protein CKM354_000555700 [Cercospora kikuchii]